MNLKDQKAELRKHLRQQRIQFHATINQQAIDSLLIARWNGLTPFLKAQPGALISGYDPTGSEINILGLMSHWIDTGYSVCVPTIQKNFQLNFTSWPLTESTENLIPDILVVPLLGFDSHGNRLGQGKGYYDTALNQLKKHKDIIAIGVGYSCQYLDKIPVCDIDYAMDFIITPEKLIRIQND